MSSLKRMVLVAIGLLGAACAEDVGGPREPVSSVTVSPEAWDVELGEKLQLNAVLRDRNNKVITGRSVTWSSSAPSIATVSATGLVTTRANGIVTITATSEGKKGTSTVSVITTVSSRLVFSGSEDRFGVGRLYSVPLGGAPQPVLGSGVLPGWTLTSPAVSPDGQRIAFTAARDAEAYIYVVNADGTALRRLTNGADEGGPAWAPDGTRIAYVSWPAGSDADIWVMNADGSGAVNITGGMGFTDQHSADWSGDLVGGSRIAFVDGDFFGGRIVTMRPDGSDVRQVTAGTPWTDSEPSWSPDGATLVFIREGPGTAGADLWLVDASGGNPRGLISLWATQANPAWSRDQGLIAFSSIHAPGSLYDVYTVTESGTSLTHSSAGAAYAVHPAWGR